eukprot:2626617-Alexandrium_andersonii.AAC.1
MLPELGALSDTRAGCCRRRHVEPAHVANPTLDLGPRHQVLDALLIPGVGARGVLEQEARASLQLGDVELHDELQAGPG